MFVKTLLSLALFLTPIADVPAKTVTQNKPLRITHHCAIKKTFDQRAKMIYSGLRTVQVSELSKLNHMEKCASPSLRTNERITVAYDRRQWSIRQQEPMAYLAWKYHRWGTVQVAYEWKVLWSESRSTPGHLNLTVSNSDCYGSGQLMGSSTTDAYTQYGGSYYTVSGQEIADLNYVAGRYGSPEVAWQHEIDYGWY